MTKRSREVALELARRAIEPAARREAEQAAGADVAARLRAVADDDEKLTVAAALAALAHQQPGPANSLADEVARRRQRANDRVLRPLPARTQRPSRMTGTYQHIVRRQARSDPTVRTQGAGAPSRAEFPTGTGEGTFRERNCACN